MKRLVIGLSLAGVLFSFSGQGVTAWSPLVEQWRPAVSEACARHGCDPDYLLGIIACESGGDPGAIGAQGEVGILQFHPAGLWGPIWDPYTQIAIAADAITSGLSFHWLCA